MMKARCEVRQDGFPLLFGMGIKGVKQGLPTFLLGPFVAEKLTIEAESTTNGFSARLANVNQKETSGVVLGVVVVLELLQHFLNIGWNNGCCCGGDLLLCC